jgi:hypothetical protein
LEKKMKYTTALRVGAVAIVFALTAYTVSAQTPQPYAGLQMRAVKSLSDGQISDLTQGRGMGLALAAELNGYPGPAHVLELASQLQLSAPQRVKVQELFDAMKAETIPLGHKLIDQETDLNRQFAERTVTEASLTSATQGIGATQAALRAAHLRYHLAILQLLAPAQTQRYVELRGYASSEHSGHQQSGRQPGGHQH